MSLADRSLTRPRPAAPPKSGAAPGFTATVGEDDYVAFCEGVRRICGVDLLQYKRGQMERRIREFAKRRGAPDLAAYKQVLAKDASELEAFLDRVTINVSQLWRHPEQWVTLASKVLPQLNRGATRLRAWSAGCSYGAEAFTLAAVCRAANASVDIVGTDLDPRMVERARQGVFSAADARLAPHTMIDRYFSRQPDGALAAKPELKSMTRFETGDLLRMPVRRGAFDVVFCRNTVIYFNDEARNALHERLAASLRPGGFLFVGTSERVADPRALGLESPFHFVYRKGQP